jgi:hypothetical protein
MSGWTTEHWLLAVVVADAILTLFTLLVTCIGLDLKEQRRPTKPALFSEPGILKPGVTIEACKPFSLADPVVNVWINDDPIRAATVLYTTFVKDGSEIGVFIAPDRPPKRSRKKAEAPKHEEANEQ